ncbi:MAG: response regulator [Myxococcales bacterium]|nr:response regulator [Myxococcales bacterium]MCB9704303.1 response regulator [Myxococcales bacterium]
MSVPRVLLVEDNVALAENVAELLEDEEIEVIVASRGDRALAAAIEGRIDLAIIDVRLPDISGIDLLGKLRPHTEGGEVIFVTGNATLDTALAAVREGVFAFVQKPFDPFDLLKLARRALDQVKLRRERARLAHELGRSEALHRGVVEAVETLIIGVDRQGVVHMWNRCASATMGWEALEALGRPLCDLLFGDDGDGVFAEWLEVAWEDRAGELQLDVTTRSGARRTIRWGQATRIEDGTTILLLVGQDVTERLALEKRAADAEAMASLATLTAGLAHEIRNPLNAAILQLELLSRVAGRLTDERARGRIGESVRLVQSEIRRLSKLLEEFLSLARPRSFELYPIRVGAVIDHVVTMQAPVAEAAAVSIKAAGTEQWPAVLGDQSKLTQVFVNLVVNAIDAIRDQQGGTIEIGAEVEGEHLVIRVVDNGPGISDEIAASVFRPFFSTKEQGTGLGLAIVKRIVDLHGGEISLRPGDGGGAVAEVRLRLAPARSVTDDDDE